MTQVPIAKTLKKIPSGNLLIPMLIVAIMNTVCPTILLIGDITTALFKEGTQCIVALILFCAGTQINFFDFVTCVKRGGILIAARILWGILLSYLIMEILPIEGIFNISLVTIISIFLSIHPGLYLSSALSYGDKIDLAAFSISNIAASPVFSMIVLFTKYESSINLFQLLAAALLPFFIGIIIGSLDISYCKLTSSSIEWLMMFLGCCFGANINLIEIIQIAPSGMVVVVIYYIISIPFILFIDRMILKRPGYAGIGISAVGGLSISVPAMVASIDASFGPYVSQASSIISFAMIMTSCITPFVNKRLMKKWQIKE